MSKHKVDEIRNVALVGHGHSGKTTLADLLLFKCGIRNRAGSVDDGTSLLDTDRRSWITIPSEKLGDITSDLNTRRGRMEGMDPLPRSYTVVRTLVR